MRPIIVVAWGVVFASILVSFAALSASAQTAASGEQQYASGDPSQVESTTPEGSSSATAEPEDAADDSPSQGSFTEGRAGPNEPSLVDDTPPSASETDEQTFSASGRASGNKVVRAARRYLGTKYRYGTCTQSRMSCTCLTKKTWRKFGHKLSMSERGQWKYERAKKVAKSRLRPGDIVFFKEGGRKRGITHVGIY